MNEYVPFVTDFPKPAAPAAAPAASESGFDWSALIAGGALAAAAVALLAVALLAVAYRRRYLQPC
jgi:hypothetical protein